MTDYEKFVKLCFSTYKEYYGSKSTYKESVSCTFYEQIKDLNCNDFYFFYFLASYENWHDLINEAKVHIDKCFKLLPWDKINKHYEPEYKNIENNTVLVDEDLGNGLFIPYFTKCNNNTLSNMCACAAEIYSKKGYMNEALDFYNRYNYYKISRLKSDFKDIQGNSVSLYSFRRFNEYTISDLINNTITVCPSTCMNDPFDSLINLWSLEENLQKTCKDKSHIKPFHDSMKNYRIRSFCADKKSVVRNILMWSHYSGDHTGICIKYKLSGNFIRKEENNKYEHMFLKKIIYSKGKIDINSNSINTNLAYATKHKIWEYENEIRLIVFNPNKKDKFYGIPLDNDSKIEAIYFGYRCSSQNMKTIMNIFKNYSNQPKYYKMELNSSDVYNMKIVKVKPNDIQKDIEL